MFATATALAAMRWAQDYYLFILGAVAFTAATIGYLHRRRHRPGDTGHIAGMGIAYTAMLTAFYVDNGPHLPLWDRLPVLAFWLLPAAIAAPLITRAIIRARNTPSRYQHRGPSGPDHQQIRTLPAALGSTGRRQARREALDAVAEFGYCRVEAGRVSGRRVGDGPVHGALLRPAAVCHSLVQGVAGNILSDAPGAVKIPPCREEHAADACRTTAHPPAETPAPRAHHV